MADFVSREKEFRKLNEKLDDEFKKSTTLSKIDKFKETRQSPLASICYDTYRIKNMGGNSDRFATYTKEKGTNLNSMRKVGGGDCAGMPIKPKSPTSPKRGTKSNYGHSFHNRAKTLPKSVNGGGAGGYSSGGGAGGGVGVIAKDVLERKQDKYCTDEQNPVKAAAPLSTNSRKSTPKDTLVVYRNDRFTCSSSMDEMMKIHTTEPTQLKKENKAGDTENNCINTAVSRAESIQPLESLGSSVAKSSQKFVNTSSLIRFLKSKVALLEENQAKNMEEMNQQKEAYEATLDRHKSVTQQLDKALNRNSTLTEQLEKTNSQLSESNRRYREQAQECSTLKKELETVKREFKHLTLNYANLEKRYERTKEETENVQKSCTNFRQSERDLKESFRREIEAKNAEIKFLKKQRSDLFTAYKKQLFLIDNLRQQNTCMEQAKMIDFCEKEFCKILEWNLKA